MFRYTKRDLGVQLFSAESLAASVVHFLTNYGGLLTTYRNAVLLLALRLLLLLVLLLSLAAALEVVVARFVPSVNLAAPDILRMLRVNLCVKP